MTTTRVAVITGANNGIGLAAAGQMAAAGLQVAMICRDRQRGERALDVVERACGQRPTLFLADLLVQAEVRRVAREVRERFAALHVLANHAGFAFAERGLTPEGFERTFALNYLAYFTLTVELLPALLASGSARIINTASEAHRWEPIDFANLQGEVRYPQRRFPPLPIMYGWTNMARIMFTFELAERLKGRGVVANCLCPGFAPVARSGSSAGQNLMMKLMRFFPGTVSAEQAARTITYLATDPDAGVLTGQYFRRGQRSDSHPQSLDVAARATLWARTLQLLGHETDPVQVALAG